MTPAAAPADAAAPASGAGEALLRRLEWTVLRRLDGRLQGNHRTLWRGTGLDLADLREYQHEDDVRHIDWNVTARLQVPYVRQFTEDRELSAWFLVDLSGSVDFGSDRQTKRRVARDFVGVLARLLTRHGNRVGAILYDRRVFAVLEPRGGRLQVLRLLQAIDRPPPAPPAAAAEGGARGRRAARAPAPAPAAGTRLAELLQAAQRVVRRRSAVFVVSDFVSEPGWEAVLGRLTLRHEVTAVRLVDPMERSLPDIGLLTMSDAETGERLLVDTSDPGLRRRFEAAAARREQALFEALGAAGVDTLELATDDDLLDAILRFADLRRQRARLAAGGGVPRHLVAPAARAGTPPAP
ncbi:DUF58 domain-containing protein [Piscinibacter sakaiensis]|uniref:DUF58 domain-containing protein n=1 Tax=Piscinibacter sakaiensis TaxID=1547922 RepID=A0A0K8NZ62_PISS1|nr:DUF58 domain-containing protein [Piscinibacter sakaiensis]GAP35210.1 hypothetical protein PA3071 [Piscinibacter sakaiensis]